MVPLPAPGEAARVLQDGKKDGKECVDIHIVTPVGSSAAVRGDDKWDMARVLKRYLFVRPQWTVTSANENLRDTLLRRDSFLLIYCSL